MQPSSPRTFRTLYDVPQRPRPEIRFPKDNVTEAGPPADEREPFVDLLLSEGFKDLMRLVVLPYIKDVRKTLVRKADLSEADRQRLIGSLYTVEHIVTQVFKRAGEPVPAWLSAQFQ